MTTNANIQKLRYVIYIRKSSENEDAQTLSLEAQKRELASFCQKHSIKPIAIFAESASAYKTGRKAFNDMLQLIEDGKADSILVYHLSRIARNSYDGGRVIYMMSESKIKQILTPSGVYSDNSDDQLVLLASTPFFRHSF